MKLLSRFAAILVLLSPSLAFAAGTNRIVGIRAFLQDPMNPTAVIQVRSSATEFSKLQLVQEGFSPVGEIQVTDNTISLYGPAPADPKLGPPVIATAVIRADVNRCLLVIAPAAEGGTMPYRLLALDDTAAAFPFGESRVVNLTNSPMGMQAGATRISLPAGEVTPLPVIKELNEYHMGQTNFYAMAGTKKEWTPFAERQLQYLNTLRRIFIIHVTPGAIAPAVRTIVDHQPFKHPDQSGING